MDRLEDIAHTAYEDDYETRMQEWLNQGYTIDQCEELERQHEEDLCACGRFISEEAHHCNHLDCPHQD